MGKKKSKGNGCGHTNYEANKKRKAAKQSAMIEKQSALKEKRLEMLEQVKAQFKTLKLGEIKKKFGTLNIHRMQDILDGTWESTTWFQNRKALRKAKSETTETANVKSEHKKKFTKKHNKLPYKSRKRKVQKIPS